MDQIENISALHDFARICNTEPDRGNAKVYAEAWIGLDDDPVIPMREVEIYFGVNKYGDPDITIDWNMADLTLKKLGVYSQFSSKFQYFYIHNERLVIQKDETGIDYKITVSANIR